MRKLDAMVAEKVMGWKRHSAGTHWRGIEMDTEWFELPDGDYIRIKPGMENPYVKPELPNFSTDIAAAWRVIDKAVHWSLERWTDGTVFCEIAFEGTYLFDSNGETPSLAICLAALRAKGVPEAKIQAVMEGSVGKNRDAKVSLSA